LVPRDILQTALLLNDENVHIRQRTHLLPQVAMTESQANDFQKKKICHPNKRPLFSFLLADGSEIHGLLPSVQRRLDLGIPCYFEPNDLAVQQVLESLDYDDDSKQQQQQQHGMIDAMDVCWALEACQGDVQQASIRIRLAQHYHDILHRQKDHPDSTSGLPLERMFRRHWEKQRHGKKHLTKSSARSKRSPSAMLVKLTVFLGLIRWICVSTPQLG
jgi:hypothetical protein